MTIAYPRPKLNWLKSAISRVSDGNVRFYGEVVLLKALFTILPYQFAFMFGELVPVGGGDPIPLMKKRLRIGRREGCDILLNFGNVSGHHALMEVDEGYWFIRDLRSRNGVKVEGKRLSTGIRKRLDPGCTVKIAKHEFELQYDPMELGAYGTPPQDEQVDDFFRESLLDRAGLRRDSAEKKK